MSYSPALNRQAIAAAVIGGPAAAALGAVLHAAVGQRAVVDVLHGLVDDLLRHGNAGVAAAAQPLHLRDRGRAFVETVAVLGADVAPAAGRRLGLAGELHGPGQHVDQLCAAVLVFLLAQHLREEQHREAVAIGVAVVAHGIADQAVRPALSDQIIDRPADVVGVLALRRRRAFAEHREPGERRHRGRIAALRRPVAQLVLLIRQPVESLAHDLSCPRVRDRRLRRLDRLRDHCREQNRQQE